MNISEPNYEECITNIACSVLNYFEVPVKHNTIPEIDEMLKTNPKNVVVILYDGMGYNLINRLLDEKSFLRTNMVKSISSICPSTTTASTTSMMSGLNPVEHGWLGWDVYIKPEDKIVTLFKNKLKDTDIDAAPYSVSDKYLSYKNIKEQINETNKYSASIIFPFGNEIVYCDLLDMNNKIIEECNKEGKRYIYAYFEDPDRTLHASGTDSNETLDIFKKIDESTRELYNKLSDTLLIVTADHGHINSKSFIIENYKDFMDTLEMDISIEPRFCSFKVKESKKNEFLRLFDLYFKDYFLLKTKQEIIDEKWFGIGSEHEQFKDSLGDYIAISTSDRHFLSNDLHDYMISHHAGLTEDEMRIPLVMKRKY